MVDGEQWLTHVYAYMVGSTELLAAGRASVGTAANAIQLDGSWLTDAPKQAAIAPLIGDFRPARTLAQLHQQQLPGMRSLIAVTGLHRV